MLVINWTPDLTSKHILVLRPLHQEEIEWLDRRREDAYAELYSGLFPGYDEERGHLGALLDEG